MAIFLAKVSKSKFPELSTRSFDCKIRGKIFNGFVIKKKGEYYAYQNLCKHLPISLDLNDNDFFSNDNKLIQCHMHGAMYAIETGLCIGGPCQGAVLNRLEIKEEDKYLVIKIPEELVNF